MLQSCRKIVNHAEVELPLCGGVGLETRCGTPPQRGIDNQVWRLGMVPLWRGVRSEPRRGTTLERGRASYFDFNERKLREGVRTPKSDFRSLGRKYESLMG